MYEYDEADLERFWAKVDKTGDCWIWTSTCRIGYGIFGLNGKTVSAHRLSYLIANGSLDPKLQVCHRCDTPACVKPEHLFQGTAQVNNTDKHEKNRGGFPLTNEQVADMRSRKKTPTMVRDLAKEFGLSPTQIKRALTGEQYSWVPGAIDVPPQFSAYKLTAQQVAEVQADFEQRKYYGQIKYWADKFGVDRQTIAHIKYNRLQYTDTL